MSNPFDSTELREPRSVLVLGDLMLDETTWGRNRDAASFNGRGVRGRSFEEAKRGRIALIGRRGE
jgi:hypothetical protein